MRLLAVLGVRLPVRILRRGSKDGMQALMRPMLSSRQLQMTDVVRFPVGGFLVSRGHCWIRMSRDSQVGSSLGGWTT